MAHLGVPRTKLWQMVNNDGLPAFQMGGDYRYRKSEIDAWIERFRVNPHAPVDSDDK